MQTTAHQIAVLVYYNSTKPLTRLTLPDDDGHLAWLQDSMDLVACGPDFSLRLSSPADLRQLHRIFPQAEQTSRHLRFRGFLRKKATRQPGAILKIEKIRPENKPTPFVAPAPHAFPVRRPQWVTALHHALLSFF